MNTSSTRPVERAEDAFSPLSRPVRRAFTLGPLGGFGLILLLTALLGSPGTAGFIASMALGTFVGGGKLIILAGAVDRAPVGTWELAALIVYIDIAVAFMVLGGMHHLYRIPGAGRRIAAARESGWRLVQRNPWMYRATWLSLAAFVAVPFQGTGAFVGVIVGRLLGLSRVAIITATAFGSIVGSCALALAGHYWQEHISALAARPWLGFSLVVVVAALTILGSQWMFRPTGETEDEDRDDPAAKHRTAGSGR